MNILKNTIQKRPKLLLVDDDDRILRSLNAILKKEYSLFFAHNAQEAKSIMGQEEKLDAIIADKVMPGGMYGDELLDWSKHHHPTVSRILLSGDFLEKKCSSDIFEYIQKPWDIKQLKNDISDAVNFTKDKRYFLNQNENSIEHIILTAEDCKEDYSSLLLAQNKKSVTVSRSSQFLDLIESKEHSFTFGMIDCNHFNEDLDQFVRNIREIKPNLQITLVTSHCSGKQVIKLYSEHLVDHYIVKPITMSKLKETLK